jgi:hypothetical protein
MLPSLEADDLRPYSPCWRLSTSLWLMRSEGTKNLQCYDVGKEGSGLIGESFAFTHFITIPHDSIAIKKVVFAQIVCSTALFLVALPTMQRFKSEEELAFRADVPSEGVDRSCSTRTSSCLNRAVSSRYLMGDLSEA